MPNSGEEYNCSESSGSGQLLFTLNNRNEGFALAELAGCNA
ncbi:hypothetical protein T4B_4981 [Trichinella pseudospiralis]|uniref:Uncharacterized protein n=1 Tax=Trichinella pseudospiralis TaxID=6337 RepID=A0A0V1GNB5_TRIPS|nr:hypothetical protein T4B_4981 [Trichinella pseudospiralis]